MSHLRVISGSARGRRLNTVPGDQTRPISDRVKEALYNILGLEVKGSKLLDLFAGTGSVGIEALSRGASYVRFIDWNAAAVKTIKQNLEITKLDDDAEVLSLDAFAFLSKSPDLAFDYIYIAPPQYHELWKLALEALDESPSWVVEDGWIIVQIDPKEYEPIPLKNFLEFDQRKYGNTALVFYEREPQE